MREPKRLSETGSPDLLETLETAREVHDSPAHLDELWGKLGERLDHMPTAAPGVEGVATGLVASSKGVWISTLVVCGGLGLWLNQAPDSPAKRPSATTTAGSPADLAPRELPWELRAEHHPGTATVERSAITPEPAGEASSIARPPIEERGAQLDHAKGTSPRRPEPAARAETPPPPAAPRSKRPSARPKPLSEVALIQAADQALTQNPSRTLALARTHARRFPAGALSQERELMRIEALRKLERTSDARTRARAFVRAFPSSPHRHQVEVFLGERAE